MRENTDVSCLPSCPARNTDVYKEEFRRDVEVPTLQSDHSIVETGRWSDSERRKWSPWLDQLGWLYYQERILRGGFLVVIFAGVPIVEKGVVTTAFIGERSCVTITQLGNGSVGMYDKFNIVLPQQLRITGGEVFVVSINENEM